MTEGGLTGRLLVASPMLRGGVFDRAVVFVLHHDPDGALGVILNRPTPVEVLDVAPRWYAVASAPSVIFCGGPVSGAQMLGLARYRQPATAGGVDVAAIAPVDLDADPSTRSGPPERLRVYAGYAGWSAGQLETEIAAGGWYVVGASPDDPFRDDPERLWRAVLRRQPAPLGLLATFPSDPGLN